MKRKTKAWLAAGLSLLTVLGCTWAYYTNEAHMNNQLQTKTYGSTITEEFTPRDDWQPGQKVDKVFAVKNTGEYPLVVRVKMEETWARNDQPAFKTIDSTTNKSDITTVYQPDAKDGKVDNDKTVVSKDLDSTNWTFNSADGYWYYNTQLTAGNKTQALLRAITLAKDADMGKYTVTSYYHEGTAAPNFEPGATDDKTATGGWKSFDGAVPAPGNSNNKIFTRTISKLDPIAMGYAGADYTLTITAETCQATLAAVQEEWKLATMPANTTWDLK